MRWVVWMRHSIVFARCCACVCSASGRRRSTVCVWCVCACERACPMFCVFTCVSVGKNNASFSLTVVYRRAETSSPCHPHRSTCTSLFLCALRQRRPFGNDGVHCVWSNYYCIVCIIIIAYWLRTSVQIPVNNQGAEGVSFSWLLLKINLNFLKIQDASHHSLDQARANYALVLYVAHWAF